MKIFRVRPAIDRKPNRFDSFAGRSSACAVAIAVSICVGESAAETGISGEDYILPEVSNAIQQRCALKFPFDNALRKKCAKEQSQGYWRFLGYVEFGEKLQSIGLTKENAEVWTSSVWKCFYKWGTRASPDFVNANRCNEALYVRATGKKPSFSTKDRID